MEELKAQMVRLKTGGGGGDPEATEDGDGDAGVGDAAEEGTPEKDDGEDEGEDEEDDKPGVSGDVEVDAEAAKKLLGMSEVDDAAPRTSPTWPTSSLQSSTAG